MIEKYFLSSGISPENVVFDPIPSYGGQWLFTINNFRRNVIDKKLWDDFYNETYNEPLKKIFQTERVLDLQVGMISKPNENNVGRCLKYNKVDFFVELTSFINQGIDNYKLTEEEKNERIKKLLSNIKLSNEELNYAYSESLGIRVKRYKDIIENGFNSEYFETAMLDYEPYKKRISFDDYIKNNCEISSKFQVGMLKLGDFFDRNVDFNRLYQLFNPDTFCLLFAKIIYEFNLKIEKEYNKLDNSYAYLCYYKMMIDELVKEDKKYNPKIKYELDNGKRVLYSRWNFTNELQELLGRHPEAGSFKLPSLDNNIDKYKDISLMQKISLLYQSDVKVNWEFLKTGEKIIKGPVTKSNTSINENKKNKEDLINEINMRISILENSGFIGRPIQGLDKFNGFYAFIYPNGKVILEKFWENIDNITPARGTATYVMNIDNFIEMSKVARIDLVSYIKDNPNCGIKRIFHTSINNWQRNLFNEINGTYRLEDAIEFINGLSVGERND